MHEIKIIGTGVYSLDRVNMPKKVKAAINFGGDGHGLVFAQQPDSVKNWLSLKQEEIKKELEKKGVKQVSVNCYIIDDSHVAYKKGGIGVAVTVSCQDVVEAIKKALTTTHDYESKIVIDEVSNIKMPYHEKIIEVS